MRWIVVLLSLLFLEPGGQRWPRPALDEHPPAQVETAVFSLGCFWGPDSRFGSLPGVVATEVGYAGGQSPQPTYDKIEDHSESIRITYDPTRITYRDLLALFWQGRHPTRPPYSRQYRSAILWNDEQQHQLALETKPEGQIYTAIEPLGTFTRAEDYHQKYHLRQTLPVFREFRAMYPNEQDFLLSTAAARANGYLGGFGNTEDLPRMGLSEPAQKILRAAKPRPGCGE